MKQALPRYETISLPELALEYDRTIKRNSRSSDRVYGINLYRYTCTCEDFITHRYPLPKTNPVRLCKHLVEELCQSDAFDDFDEPMRLLLTYAANASTGLDHAVYSAGIVDGRRVVFGHMEENEVIQVYLQAGRANARRKFEFHPATRRWHPQPPADVRTLLRKLVGSAMVTAD